MHQWKKLLAQGKLIKKLTVQDRHVSITLQDEHNKAENYRSINNMFSNFWNLVPEFRNIFEKAKAHSNLPYLFLKKSNHYLSDQDALASLISLCESKSDNSSSKTASISEVIDDEHIETANQIEQVIIKPKKNKPIVHAWKKLLSKGELIQSLELKDGFVKIKLLNEYDNRSYYKAINIMIQKLYLSSEECQKTYRKPTIHTSAPYLIPLNPNSYPDNATALVSLIQMALQPKKLMSNEEIIEDREERAENGITPNERAKELDATPKVEDIYDIFKDLLEDPVQNLDEHWLATIDIEDNRPFLGFSLDLPEKTTTLTANIQEPKVPILRLKVTVKR